MSDRHDGDRLPGTLPKATVRRNWWTRAFWLVPIAAAMLAGWFVYEEVFRTGPTIHVTFEDAGGLEPGKSQLKYRGVRIGIVKDIELTTDHRHARVTVSLERSGHEVAREGARFWIVEPRVRLAEVRGLSTIVGGDYLAVEPGDGKPETSFTGLSQPPLPVQEQGGLRIVLLAERANSVKEHTPVFYRGINVGEVRSFGLGHLSQDVRIHVEIKKGYEALVRMNSKFWNAGGIDLSVGLSGLSLSAKSASTLITGGIAFATPDDPGTRASPGTAFRLYDKADPDWLKWAPAIKNKHVPSSEPSDRYTEAP